MPGLLPLSLDRRAPGRIRPRLDALAAALSQLGSPQQHFRSILVVGTNGKGSSVAILDRILRQHGLSCGRYTSPHLVGVEERITIHGTQISSQRLADLAARLDTFEDLTFFETLTAAAFLAFAEDRVEVAVLEAGMGGLWDATRLAKSEIAGLTNVGSDHGGWLGATREAIAADKGAALAAARIGVVGPGVDRGILPALGACEAVAAADLVALDARANGSLRASWLGESFDVRLPLAGPHQRDNLHLALALCRAAESLGWCHLQPSAIQDAVAGVEWPGRLAWHSIGGRRVLLDGAHNREGAQALATALRDLGLRPSLLFSCLDDKPVEDMAEILRPVVSQVVVCPLDDDRAMPVDRLASAFPDATVAASPNDALDRLTDPVLAAGSLRLVGALLEREDRP